MVARISGSVGSYESGSQNSRADVRTVQQLLTEAATTRRQSTFDPGAIDGLISRTAARSSTVKAITAFQSIQVRMTRPDQRTDVGGSTWQQLVGASGAVEAMPQSPASTSAFVNALVRIAEGEVGVMEGATNNTGDELQKYKEATGLAPGAWAWCAAFVCWCYKEALAEQPLAGVRRPRSAGAWRFEEWANAQTAVTLLKPAGSIQKGDIVIYTYSHIGIAVADEQGGMVQTVEGNTNIRGERDGGGRSRDGVYRKTRPTSSIRSVARTG